MEDDDFLKQFMERAKRREVKLAKVEKPEVFSENGDVSYPPLSPLREEEETTIRTDTEYQDGVSNTDYGGENRSPNSSEMNYSSDLSLECESTTNVISTENEVYRAEPVLCHSSPEQNLLQQYQLYASPRKTAPSESLYSEQLTEPLHERQGEQKASSSESLPAALTDKQIVKKLKDKALIAETTKGQLKKVVEISRYGSKDHIEAARRLQIADAEHLCFTNHAAMYEKGIRKKVDSLGSLKLSNIRLKVTSKLRNDLADDCVAHNFFCIAVCGTEVKSTEVVDTYAIRRQDLKAYLKFDETISFTELPPEFVVKLEIFELIIGQPLPKFLSRLTPSKKTKMTPESYFRRVGSLRLTLSDREVSYKNLLRYGATEDSKYIEKECKFLLELKPDQLPSKAGMLHVRCLDNEGRPDWSRFWVDLSCGQMRFWKSKQDLVDEKKPNQIIEFQDICSLNVQKLTPDDDLYRQNSFVLYSLQQVVGGEGNTLFQRIKDQKMKLVKHQFATENKEDRDSWCAVLDKSITCFREWHSKAKVFTPDEVKEVFYSSY